jgi:hypothetical protein
MVHSKLRLGRGASAAGLVGRQRRGDLVEACAERDGDRLGHPAAAESARGQIDVIVAVALVRAIGHRGDPPVQRAVNGMGQSAWLTALPA